MSKRKKLYLARRMLAMILAAALSVTMLPSTALAVSENDLSQITEMTEENGAAEKTGDADTPEEDGISTDADENKGGNADQPQTDGKTEDKDSDTTDGEDADQSQTDDMAEVKAENDDAAKAEIILDSAFATKAGYDGNAHFGDIKDYVTLKKDGKEVTDSAEIAKISVAWKKGAEDAYADMTGTPTNAGSYRAVLSYDGAEKTVDCEIAQASVTVNLKSNDLTVKPGTLRKNVGTPEVVSLTTSGGDGLDPEHVTLTEIKIQDAFTNQVVEEETPLKKNGDYVMAITPTFSNQASTDQQNNYELKPFTAKLTIANLIMTKVEAAPTAKWKQEDNTYLIWKSYDGQPMTAPEAGLEKDYTFAVSYYDGTAWQPINDAQVVGEWQTTSGDAPTEAGYYTYQIKYAGEDGVYAESNTTLDVEIKKAQLTVEATNEAPLKVLQDSTVKDLLSKIKYKVTDQDGKDVTEDVKSKHVWGTGNSTSISQIYEPLFTVEESDDNTTWTAMDSTDIFAVSANKKYRAVFNGKKAIFYSDGSYSDATGINSTTKQNGYSSINGIDNNYETIETTAAGKELAVEVTPGAEAVIDVSGLLGENKGAETITDLTAVKEYDSQPLFATKYQYKKEVKLKAKTGDTPIETEFTDFTYTWQKYTGGDLINAKIAVQNGTDASMLGWSRMSYNPSPKDAGVYKLTITYEDQIDDDTLYYVNDPKVVYFAIDPKQVKIVPTTPTAPYEVFADSSAGYFFDEQEPAYEVQAAAGGTVTVDSGVVVRGKIVQTEQQTAPATPITTEFVQYEGCEWEDFNGDTQKYSYQLYGAELSRWNDDDYEWYADPNYTCYAYEIEGTGSAAQRKRTFLNTDSQPIAVVPMGTEKLTITVDPEKLVEKSKVYDGKPFTEKDLIADGLVTVSDPEVKLSYFVYNDNWQNYWDIEGPLSDAREVGTYTLYAMFNGDKKYAPYRVEGKDYPECHVKLGTFTIMKREITLTADLEESYSAGTLVSNVLRDVNRRYQVNNYVKGQEEAFANKEKVDWDNEDYDYYLKAWGYDSGPYFYVTEAGFNQRLSSSAKLERNKTYEVRYDSGSSSLSEYDSGWDTVNDTSIYPATNYTVKNDPVATFKVEPGNSTISSVSYSNGGRIPQITIQTQNDKNDPMTREVTMREAIRWTTQVTLGGKSQEGNFVAFRITKPAEYASIPATAMYENAIKAQGGYVVNSYSNYFTAVFNAADGDKEFKIRWEEGYVETYKLKFKEAVKLPNLNDAVAAKALAFNGAKNKMAVGDTQQLDVKITKEQMGDVIYLGYESSDPETLVVNSSGYVTALKMGSATITVFPQHLVNGSSKTEKIKNAKTASIKITVTKLDAPKKVKAIAHDNTVDLYYDKPAYGYRREIYVVKKSNNFKKTTDFEKVLADMKEDQWKANGFAIAPVYLSGEYNNSSRKTYLSNLDAKTDYTIYVRNVCQVRNVTGGTITRKAMLDSAAGTLVNVKTKKAEVKALSLDIDPKALTYVEDFGDVVKFSALKNGTVECRTVGSFPAEAQEELGADPSDRVQIALPFSGQDKAKYKNVYEEPKLEYALYGCYDKKTDTYDNWGTKNDYASIDKKGKIKITGFPEESYGTCSIWVRVRDVNTGASDTTYLTLLFEEADSVLAAKGSVTYTVGQGGYLGNLLAYKLGKQKLTAYPWRSIDLVKVRKAIRDQKQEDYFTVSEDGYLTAIKGGGTLKLDLTDKNVERISGTAKATAKVTVKSKDLEAVKGLKACDVIHNRFGLTFSYTGGAKDFLLEISDAKKPIYSKILTKYEEGIHPLRATDKKGRYIDAEGNLAYYDDEIAMVKNTYEIPDWYINEEIEAGRLKLTKETQYTVSLTPIYGANKAKAATTKVKTTKIPAQDWYLNNDNSNGYWEWGCDRLGGMSITVSEGNGNAELNEYNSTLYTRSGNSCTLTANVQYNRGRVNDTLVWTVGDAKVAKVKAAAGTYAITLTGLKKGYTTLEVKSKITGKVIARYGISVNTVGNAYNPYSSYGNYYGENEPE